MKIQVINNSKEKQEKNVLYTTMESPRSLDEYDVVVIDLKDDNLWINDSRDTNSINSIKDFLSIKKMIEGCHTATIIVSLPQNATFSYNKHIMGTHYEYLHTKIKDVLSDLRMSILPQIMPCFIPYDIIYENTETVIGEGNYKAAFFFEAENNILTKSKMSNKATTIQLSDRIIVTTLQITQTTEELNNFLSHVLVIQQKEKSPEWMQDIAFFDDVEQKETISASLLKIKREEALIKQAEERLSENAMYKSILFTNGDELVKVVFLILEKILDYDLSEFVDEKKADFIIKKEHFTIVGEIKGISDNVKKININQLENHYYSYIESLQGNGEEEKVYQVLIINPFRNKPLSEREPIHEDPINVAIRNNALIVETKTLLQLFERFLQGNIGVEDCEKVFTTKTGLLLEEDIV